VTLTAERVQQLHASAVGIKTRKIRLEAPANPPSDTEVGLSLDKILLRRAFQC
jgi:hypothetical protein